MSMEGLRQSDESEDENEGSPPKLLKRKRNTLGENGGQSRHAGFITVCIASLLNAIVK